MVVVDLPKIVAIGAAVTMLVSVLQQKRSFMLTESKNLSEMQAAKAYRDRLFPSD